MKIEINNFQKLKDQTLEIPEGFNCIVGSSNLGKSTLLRSLFSVFRNDFHPSYISKNENQCRISVSMEGNALREGIDHIELIKGRSDKRKSSSEVFEVTADSSSRTNTDKLTENTYVIRQNGADNTFPKVGKDIPQLMAAYDFSPVITEREDSFDLNYQSQFDGMFLFTDSEPAVSSLFNVLFDTTRYEKALKLMLSDISKYTKEYNQIKDDIPQARAELETITADLEKVTVYHDTLSSLLIDYETSENNHKTLLSDMETLKTVESLSDDVFLDMEAVRENGDLSGMAAEYMESLSDYQRVRAFVNLERSIRLDRDSSDRCKALCDYISSVTEDMEHLYALRSLKKLEGGLKTLDSYSEKCKTLCGILENHTGLCMGYQALRDMHSRYSEYCKSVDTDNKCLMNVNSLAVSNEHNILLLSDIKDIRVSVSALNDMITCSDMYKKQSETAISYIKDITDRIDETIKVSGHCPLCGHKHTKKRVKTH